jgi:hypothetical protein
VHPAKGATVDDNRYDDLAKALAGARSRRDVIKRAGRALAIAVGFGGPVGGILWSGRGEAALCPTDNLYGRNLTCCRPQGGHCTTGLDCCKAVADTTLGRDSCSADGVCGGAGAFCSTDSDCVDGRECIGACFGIGSSGNDYCDSSADCPPINGNGQLCRQQRCIYRSELP